jgi:hypothetical protein
VPGLSSNNTKQSMKPVKHALLCGMVVTALLVVASSVRAQVQTTGTPGSPSATTTISGEQLPAPPGKFGGVIKVALGN